jgi:hypothetical protein
MFRNRASLRLFRIDSTEPVDSDMSYDDAHPESSSNFFILLKPAEKLISFSGDTTNSSLSAISCSASNLATLTLSNASLVGAMVHSEYHLVDRNYLSAAVTA